MVWSIFRTDRPKPAPEADRILQTQAALPFQPLIPAFLPTQFNRAEVEILTDKPGPKGEIMLQLVYTTDDNQTLTLSEYIPQGQIVNNAKVTDQSLTQAYFPLLSNLSTGAGMQGCMCRQQSQSTYTESTFTNSAVIDLGPLHVTADRSSSQFVTDEQLLVVLNTLSPAADLVTYTTLQNMPLTVSLPDAVEVPLNNEGVQDLVLIVTPQGYSPAHFSVRKDLPVRITFRQLGEVYCGNELILRWDSGKQAVLVLQSQNDKETVDFTPEQSGDYQFNCPYLHYIGVMTIVD